VRHAIRSVIATLRGAEWMPITVVRVLIGIFFAISGGTKLLVPAQFSLMKQTMVQVAHSVSGHQCAFRIAGRIRVRCWLGAWLAHARVRASSRGRHDCRDNDQSNPKHPG